MEERDFAYLCSVLSTAGAKVPLQETFFFSKEEVSLWVVSSKAGSVRRVVQTEEPIKAPGEVVRYFEGVRSQETPGNPTVCVGNVKGVRLPVTEEKIEEASSLRGAFSRCSYMQKPLDDKPVSLLHVLKIELQGSCYTSWFLLRRNSTKHCSDQRLYYKLLVIVKIVLRSLEMVRRRRVAQLELEFYLGSDGDVRLCGCPFCKLVPLNASFREAPTPVQDPPLPGSDSPTRSKPLPDFETKPILTSVKPQPRISTPVQFREEAIPVPVSDPVPDASPVDTPVSSEPRPVSKPLSTPKIPNTNSTQTFQATTARSVKSSQKRTVNFYNANFKEMLAKTYAKSLKCFPDDIEQIFQDMDMKLLRDEEPIQTVRKHGNPLFRRSDSGVGQMDGGYLDSERKKQELQRKPTITETSPDPPPVLLDLLRPTQSSYRPQRRPKRKKVASSKTLSSLQKILDLYESEKRLSYLTSKYEPILHRKMHSLPSQPASQRKVLLKPLM